MKFGTFSSLLVTLALVCSSVVDAKYFEATDANFNSLVLNSRKTVIALFCTPLNSSCKEATPIVDKVVAENSRATMVYVDINKYPRLADKYKSPTIPALKAFYAGNLIDSDDGPINEESVAVFLHETVS